MPGVSVRRALCELIEDQCDCDTKPCGKDEICCLPLLTKGASWPEPSNTDDLDQEGLAWWACGSDRSSYSGGFTD